MYYYFSHIGININPIFKASFKSSFVIGIVTLLKKSINTGEIQV